MKVEGRIHRALHRVIAAAEAKTDPAYSTHQGIIFCVQSDGAGSFYCAHGSSDVLVPVIAQRLRDNPELTWILLQALKRAKHHR